MSWIPGMVNQPDVEAVILRAPLLRIRQPVISCHLVPPNE